jgi:hypothetical protein
MSRRQMATCGFCFGSLTAQCMTCSGRRYTQRIVACGEEPEVIACAACAGTGRVRCQYCCAVNADEPRAVPAAFSVCTAGWADPLAGCWHGLDGSSWEFIRNGETYIVRETSPSGELAEGYARLVRDVVKLEVIGVAIGKTRCELRLRGDTLAGTMQFLGLPAPLTLNRGAN